MPSFQPGRDVFEAESAISQQNDQVVDQIGGLIDGFLLGAGGCSQGEFDAFLADFLRNPLGARGCEARRVTFLSTSCQAIIHYGLEFGDESDIGFGHDCSSDSDVDMVVSQVLLEFGYRDFGTVEHTRRQRAVYTCFLKDVQEMFASTCAARRDQWYIADLANGSKLRAVIALTNAILVHAVKNDLTCTTHLGLTNPLESAALRGCRLVRVAGVLVHDPVTGFLAAVDADDDALRAKSHGEVADQFWIGEGGGVDGYLVGPLVQDVFRVRDALDAAGHAKRNVEYSRDTAHPATIDGAVVGARGDVVEDKFIGAFISITCCQIENVANDAMIAKLDALDDDAVTYVEARDYSLRRND